MFDKAKSFFGKLGPIPKIIIILIIVGIVLYVANTVIDFNSGNGVSSDIGKSSVTATEEEKPVKKSRGKQTTFYE